MEEPIEMQRFDYPVPRREMSDKTVRWKIDPEDVINEIIHHLRGDVFDETELEWKPQGYIYHFKVIAPVWVHEKIMELEGEGFIKFDIAKYDRNNLNGYYSVYDFRKEIKENEQVRVIIVNSCNNLINLLEQCKKKIDTNLLEIYKPKEILYYSFEKEEPQRLVNEFGLRVIATTLRGYLNKNIILSNYQTDEIINNIAMENAIEFTKLIYTSHDKFAIKKENFSTIVRLIDVNVHAALLRAKEGFFVHHLSTTERHIEHENVTLQNRSLDKPKLFPSIFGNWGNKEA